MSRTTRDRDRLHPVELIAMAWRTARMEPARVIVPALVIFGLDAIQGTLYTELAVDHLGLESLAGVFLFGASTLVLTFYSGMLERLVGSVERNEPAQPVLVVLRSLPWLRLLAAEAILVLISAAASLLLIVPGLIVGTLFALYRPDLPGPAAAAILSALAKDPRRRFESAGALALAFATGVEGSWTAANSEQASMQDCELTQPYPVRSWRPRPRAATRPSLRVGVATLAAAVLLGGGIVAAQAIQSEGTPSLSERPAFHSVAINGSAPERTMNTVANSHLTKSTPTRQQPLTTVIRYRGSQVYAQRSDGKLLWTVWTDGMLAAPPRIRGDIIYLTTLIGSQYTLRAGDGEILSLVTVAMQQGNQQDNQQDNQQGNQHNNGHGKGDKHHGHHGGGHGNGQGDNSNSD